MVDDKTICRLPYFINILYNLLLIKRYEILSYRQKYEKEHSNHS